jgi:iron complex outermembrane recepter protein
MMAGVVLALSIHAQARLIGTVRSAEGDPLGFAQVRLMDKDLRATADPEGVFRISGLWEGDHALRISFVGYVPLDTTVRLQQGDNTLMFRLRPAMNVLEDATVSALRAGDRAPFARTLVTKEEIQRINTGVDLPYLLDLQPSVVVTSDGGTGIGYTAMRIRGSDATRTNITLNGVPFNDQESQGAFLVNLPDLATSAEDIEMQRGVGTSTNGPAAFGASVNLRTTAVRKDAWGLVSVSGGSYNTQRYSVSAGTGLLGATDASKFTFDMRLSSITTDGYIDRATADLKSYFLQAAWIGKSRSVRFIIFQGKEVTYQAWDGVPREVIDTARTYNGYTYENEVDDYDQTHYQVLLEQRIGSKATLDLTLFHMLGEGYYEQYRADDDLSTYGIPSAVIDGDTITTTDIIRRRWLDNALTGANLSADIKLGAHRLVLGGSYSHNDGAHFGEVIWARYAGDGEVRDRYYDNDAEKNDANAFAKLTYALNAKLDVYGDVQVRRVDYSFLGFNEALDNITQEVDYTFFNPKAGALWRLHEGGKLYASFAVANREPNRNDLEETTPTSRPRSERLLDYELGYERRNGRFSAGVNAYYMDYTDQLVLTGELNDVGAALRTNVANSYRAGLEFMFAVQPVERLTWRANATLSRNKVQRFDEFVDDWDNGGQVLTTYAEGDLAFSPSVIAGSELGYRVWQTSKGRADITWVTKYVGEQYLDNSASARRMLDPYVVNDLRVNVTLSGLKGTRGVDLNLTVRNLLNALYESNGWVYSYVSEGRRQEMVNLFPQAPLNVLGGVSVRF